MAADCPIPANWHERFPRQHRGSNVIDPLRQAFMKEQAIRTTVDIPASLYRKLKAQAAAQGRSVRELILLGVRITLVERTDL